MFKNMKISKKLIIFTGVLLALMLLMSGIGIYSSTLNKVTTINMYENQLKAVENINDIRANARANEGNLFKIVLYSGDNKEIEEIEKEMKLRTARVEEMKEALEGLELSDKELEQYNLSKESQDKFREIRLEIIDAAKTGNEKEARALLFKSIPAQELFQEAYYDLSTMISESAKYSYESTLIKVNYINKALILYAIIAFVFGSIISYSIIRSITRPINETVEHITILSTGDFSRNVDEKLLIRKDEMGVLANSVDKMQKAIASLIKSIDNEVVSINQIVVDVEDNVTSLNDDTQNVSTTTEELAANMEETAASAEEMLATALDMENSVNSIAEGSKAGADKATEINKNAQKIMISSENNKKETEQMVKSTTKGLKIAIEKAKAIEEIHVLAESIKEITEQTNLLALNAAIEAAGAGEVGRGFSVVADEIRKLVENSKETVIKIQEITEQIVDSVTDLTVSSENMMIFINEHIMPDYEILVKTSIDYSNDANYYEEFSEELNSSAQYLLSSILNLTKVVEVVAMASTDGAEGTSEIAERATNVFDMSDKIHELIRNTTQNTLSLRKEVDNFKI